jgi:hypothetical protein
MVLGQEVDGVLLTVGGNDVGVVPLRQVRWVISISAWPKPGKITMFSKTRKIAHYPKSKMSEMSKMSKVSEMS